MKSSRCEVFHKNPITSLHKLHRKTPETETLHRKTPETETLHRKTPETETSQIATLLKRFQTPETET